MLSSCKHTLSQGFLESQQHYAAMLMTQCKTFAQSNVEKETKQLSVIKKNSLYQM